MLEALALVEEARASVSDLLCKLGEGLDCQVVAFKDQGLDGGKSLVGSKLIGARSSHLP
ncbi:hypothetical protein [Ktedonobacter racemifer]|uniref:Uncharacterized protein n=1 Tax=Ktedonobacter racemifer DSM 44963 TaxID=485913 RepID=D6TZL3_KTERA|nr:hypothetical protein [Ktedonobacter racemifer]EFH82003.1 hypothetical protein Krac_2774 [Ktedonobacter racemifer DSM 44963]